MLSNFMNNKLYYRLTIKVLIYVFILLWVAVENISFKMHIANSIWISIAIC